MTTVSLLPLFNGWQGFPASGVPLAGGGICSLFAARQDFHDNGIVKVAEK